MTDEIIVTYTKDKPDEPIALSRKEYYSNEHTTYADYFPAIIDIMLINRFGELLFQKRGYHKANNPGKLNTTVGGHINEGEDPHFTMVHECIDELGAPVLLFKKEQLKEATVKLGAHTKRAALAYYVGDYYRDYQVDEDITHTKIKDRIWAYVGLYDGPIESPDRDSAGYEWMDLETYDRLRSSDSHNFTDGVMKFLKDHRTDIESFIKTYCTQPVTH